MKTIWGSSWGDAGSGPQDVSPIDYSQFPPLEDIGAYAAGSGPAAPATGGAGTTQMITHAGSGLAFVNTYGSGVTAAFQNVIVAAETYLESHFTNPITIYANFDLQNLNNANISGENSFSVTFVSYATLVNALQNNATSPDDIAAVNALRNRPDPSNGDLYAIPVGEARVLGLLGPGSPSSPDDSVVLNSQYWSDTAFVNNPGAAVGVLMHELSEGAMGRIGGIFTQPGFGTVWTPMNLFRYNLSHALDDTGGRDGQPTYFSTNGQNINTGLQYHNPINAQGTDDGFDWADWDQVGQDANASDPFGPGGPNAPDPGILSATDLQIMDVLGWTEPPPASIAVTGTTAMAVQGGPPIALLASPATITDPNTGTMTGATVHIASGGGSIFPGDELFLNGVQSGTINGVSFSWNDSTKVLTLTGSASTATYQNLLGLVSYEFLGTDGTSNHTQHTVTWTVSDGTQSPSTTSVVAIDHAPVANNDVGSTTPAGAVNIPAGSTPGAGVLANDVDQDHDPLTVVAVNGQAANVGHAVTGTKGQLTLNFDGSYSYTPNPGVAVGSTDAFAYTVSDGHGGTSTATLTVTIRPTTKDDFNADARSDVLFRNAADGSVGLWTMNGAQVLNSLSVSGPGNTNMKIVGTGDFNGDFTSDILWQSTSDGTVSLWEMRNGQQLAAQTVSGPMSSDWQIAGTGDFNGDGKADILWDNTSTGAIAAWDMNGFQVLQNSDIFTVPTNSGWQIVGTGEFNGDGKTDILWDNTNTGSVGLWEMNGSQVLAMQVVYVVPSSSGWQITGVGDFNSDGKADILWHNTINGQVGTWEMNGFQIADWGVVGVVDPSSSWHIVGTGDYLGDGHSDILWQNSVTNGPGVWELNGFQVTSMAATSTALPKNSSIVTS
jgi:hypothetical protein